jgi:hypothetical protein
MGEVTKQTEIASLSRFVCPPNVFAAGIIPAGQNIRRYPHLQADASLVAPGDAARVDELTVARAGIFPYPEQSPFLLNCSTPFTVALAQIPCSTGEQYPLAQQVELRSAEHLPLHQLRPRHLPLHLP